jgi:hypothetical protein
MNHSAYAPAAGEMRAVIYEQAKSASELRAGKLGTLQIQLVYYRGLDECRASRWTSNAHELARIITGISCRAGTTQIGKILAHIRKENAAQKVSTAIFVGDAMEETPSNLYDAAAALGVPFFCCVRSPPLRPVVSPRSPISAPMPRVCCWAR